MTLHYNVAGDRRKELVMAMAEILDCKAEYLKMPTKAYRVDYFTIAPNGDVTFDDFADSEEIENLIDKLAERGFSAEPVEDEQSEDTSDAGLTVCLPLKVFSSIGSLDRLHSLIAGKHTLLQKALEVDKLPIQVDAEKVSFPWFRGDLDADHVKAYTMLIAKLVEMANHSKRITVKDKETDNAKYAMRCFLLRLGFIGDEYKTARKILLHNLEGSAAFRRV